MIHQQQKTQAMTKQEINKARNEKGVFSAYNKRIGGKSNSYHLKAMAADITIKSKTPAQLKQIVEDLISKKVLKFGGIGLYPGFLHVDIRKGKARW